MNCYNKGKPKSFTSKMYVFSIVHGVHSEGRAKIKGFLTEVSAIYSPYSELSSGEFNIVASDCKYMRALRTNE